MAKGHSKEPVAGKTTSNRKLRRLAHQESELPTKPRPRKLPEVDRSDNDDLDGGYSTDNTFSHSGDDDCDDCDTSISSLGVGSVSLLESEEPPVNNLNDCIASIQEFKRANNPKNIAERTKTLTKYAQILRAFYFGREISSTFPAIRRTLLRLITSPGNLDEQLLALKCLGLTMLSCATAGVYDEVQQTLKRICQDDATRPDVKSLALVVLGVAVVFGYAGDEDRSEVLEFLTEAIESDGSTLEATDSGSVVATALRVWGFVACQYRDLEEIAVQAMDAFIDQLDSTDIDVESRAAFNIALVFEASRNAAEQHGKAFNIRQDPKDIVKELKGLAQQSKNVVGRKNGREVATRLGDVIVGLELGYGPNYSTAGRPLQNPHTGVGKGGFLDPRDFKEFGYRDKVIDKDGEVTFTVTTWAESVKIKILRTLLLRDAYVATHLEENPELREELFPEDDEDDDDEDDD